MSATPEPCDPTWHDQPPDDTTPPPGLLRLQELHDLQDQKAGPYALRTAVDIPTGSYL